MAGQEHLAVAEDPDREVGMKEACEYLEIKPKTLYNLIHDGQGPERVKEGKHWRFKVSALARYKAQRRLHKRAFTK